MPLITEADAPLAIVVTPPDGSRVRYWNHGGKLVGWTGEVLGRPDGDTPLMKFSAIGDVWDKVILENRQDAAASAKDWRTAISAAKRWAGLHAIMRDDDGDLLCLRSTVEPALVVSPPLDASNGPWTNPRRWNTILCVRVDYHPDRTGTLDIYEGLLREDRWFSIDEMDAAAERAREYEKKISKAQTRFEVRDRSCFVVEPSVLALRLTAREAIEAAWIEAPELAAAKNDLAAVVDDPGANAAAICPHARRFLACFGASQDTLEFSRLAEVAPYLERLQRAHDRAQLRMAANLISDRDPRVLAEEDDLVLGRLGM